MIDPRAIPPAPRDDEIGGVVNASMTDDGPVEPTFCYGSIMQRNGLGYFRTDVDQPWQLGRCVLINWIEGIDGPVYHIRAL